MSPTQSSSRIGKFVAGPLGIAIAAGLLLGFNKIFSQMPIGERIVTWVSWGFLGILLLVVSVVVLCALALAIAVAIVLLFRRYVAEKENRLLSSRDLPGLRTTLAGDDPELRRAAMRALGKEVAKQNVDVEEIASYLNEDDEKLATVAAETLKKLKHRSRPAVTSLLDALENEIHQSARFRIAVFDAIEKAGHNSAEHKRLIALRTKIRRWKEFDYQMTLHFILQQKPYDLKDK